VPEPVKLRIKEVLKTFHTKIPLHPDKPERGYRNYTLTPNKVGDVCTWISKKDTENAEIGEIVRLMELFNVRIEGKTAEDVVASFTSESYEEIRKKKARLIHWIPQGEEVSCKVVMPDASVNEGLAESACKKLKPNDVIQFERFGFVRIDEVKPKLKAYYAHK
jgi:glutamyl-tRNA synthetase